MICKINEDPGNSMMSEPESTLHTRPSLLVRLRNAEDDAAWRAFVDTYAPLLYRWCRRQGLQDADAADVSQDVLLQVARSLRAFEYSPERGRFRGWLGTVTHRRLLRFRQRRERGAVAAGEGAEQVSAAADPEWAAAFNAQVLQAALERVRPDFEAHTWQAFELTWLAGHPAPEAAARVGLSVQAVYVAKHRVLKRLEAEVLHLAEDLPLYVPLR
jgi:RNA polymerase sigma factor (sigma-70 family)